MLGEVMTPGGPGVGGVGGGVCVMFQVIGWLSDCGPPSDAGRLSVTDSVVTRFEMGLRPTPVAWTAAPLLISAILTPLGRLVGIAQVNAPTALRTRQTALWGTP